MSKHFICSVVLITFLAGSCCPQCNHWKMAVIKADCPTASYVKVYLPPCNTFNGLEAVFMSCNGNIQLYFNALTLLFPCLNNDERHTEISITAQDEKYSFIAERLQGGQRLLMPDEAMLLIALNLLEKGCVEVNVGRYHALLTHENFAKAYRCLNNT